MSHSIPIGDVEAELDKMDATRKSEAGNLILLAASVALFVATGLLRFSVESLAVLLVVLFIHEGGHWLGMKLSAT
ncbi:MAG TPA: hypothetical protein VG733_11755 [Chthoniobacteraceae bacterium]|nr:hypothetical protein [Chthoniobacteraceae bacterium]